MTASPRSFDRQAKTKGETNAAFNTQREMFGTSSEIFGRLGIWSGRWISQDNKLTYKTMEDLKYRRRSYFNTLQRC